MTPDPKQPRRVRLPRAAYGKLRAEILTEFPMCACNCGRRATEIHHLIGGAGRSDVRENMVGLSGWCHSAFTSRMRTWDNGHAIDPLEVAYGLRETMEERRPEVLAYIMENKGQDFLDSAYPLR